jgi:hypothetical protein
MSGTGMKTIDEDELYCTEDGSYEYEDQPFTGLARDYSKDGKLISETVLVQRELEKAALAVN